MRGFGSWVYQSDLYEARRALRRLAQRARAEAKPLAEVDEYKGWMRLIESLPCDMRESCLGLRDELEAELRGEK